jgi:hypothetical protein
MGPCLRLLGLLGLLAMPGCAEPAASTIDARPAMLRLLEPWGLQPASAPTEIAMLAWHAPSDACHEVYRITTSYEPALRFEEDSTSWLALGRDPRRPAEAHVEGEPIRAGEVVPGRLYYHGLRAERDGASRDVSYGRELYGPAAPSAGCLPQTWDPMEDAFALGWPKLPGRLVAVGERWNGLRVEAKCNRAACVDPLTGGGGPDNHERACVTQDWQETLLGIYENEADGERYAWIGSTWTDGHEGKGIDTQRFTLVSIDHGRPVWSQTVLTHRFSQPIADGGFAPVVRTWQLEAVDDCEGALPAAGWNVPPHIAEELAAEVARMREGLADVDALRRRGGRNNDAKSEE